MSAASIMNMPTDKRKLYRMLIQATLVACGVWLIIMGAQFAGLNESQTSSTKGDFAALGAAIGAGVGIGTYLIVGGIGVATGGIGFAIGGLGLTLLGASAGALGGAATGTTTIVIYSYPTWLWLGFIVLGCAALFAAYRTFRAERAADAEPEVVSAGPTRLPAPALALSARVAAVLLVGVLIGSYASTLTKRRPAPATTLENVVFANNSMLNRAKEHLLWPHRTKLIESRWDGYYLIAGSMTFRERDGKWREQEDSSK